MANWPICEILSGGGGGGWGAVCLGGHLLAGSNI